MLKVWVGLPASHEPFDKTPVCWRFRSVRPGADDGWREVVDEHAGGARKTLERWRQGLVTGDKGGTTVDLDARPAERGASEEPAGPKSEGERRHAEAPRQHAPPRSAARGGAG